MKQFIKALILAAVITSCSTFAIAENLKLIETSEKEISQLQTDGYIAEAKQWLKFARERSSNNKANIKYCLEYLKRANVTPEFIGTSEKEFDQLLHDGYIAEAKMWLKFARERSGDNEANIRYCLEYLKRANVTPEFIGTSEKELSQL